MSTITHGASTDIGRRREHNEDAFHVVAERHLYLVADGLGGYAAGEVASRLAVDTVARFFDAMDSESDLTWASEDSDPQRPHREHVFACAAHTANRRVWEVSQRYRAYRGMSTTLVGLHLEGDSFAAAWVGDSRCYLFRDGMLQKLTTDHAPAPANGDDSTHLLLRAIGVEPTVQVDTLSAEWKPGDLFLLCSDGLTGEVGDSRTSALIEEHAADPDALSQALVDEANRAGGRDNITVVAVQIPADYRGPVPRPMPPETAEPNGSGLDPAATMKLHHGLHR